VTADRRAASAPTAAPATGSIAPIANIYGINGGCVLGSTDTEPWRTGEATGPLLAGDERYQLYTLSGPVGEATGSTPFSEIPCPATQNIEMTPPVQLDAPVIAVSGDWNAMPRVPTLTSTEQEVYQQAAAEVLRGLGLETDDIRLEQVIRIDLEGDGSEEVLVTATRISQETGGGVLADPGDYSVVFLRKLVGETVETSIVEQQVYPLAQGGEVVFRSVVEGVLDVDGDGMLEVLVTNSYYEGGYMTVYRLNGHSLEASELGCGCGV
ncbi:MAG: hypothetical protein HC914_18390, partial [Chloroflexaceae bacterium]|nr:hypothetical protein [Chloroflexaceae bacterium]